MAEKVVEEIITIIKKLRKECPWDRKQTIKSLIKDLMSEAREVEQAVKNNDMKNLKEELGDIIWSALLMAEIGADQGYFTVDEMFLELKDKMIRRHPHVFGKVKAETAEDALKAFLEAKKNEKQAGEKPE